jgi:hypothetical protein
MESVLETLRMQCRRQIECQGAKFSKDMAPTAEQAHLLSLLKRQANTTQPS